MNPQKLFEIFLANLPVLLSFLGAVGLWKMLAAIGRKLWGDLRQYVVKTDNKIDDAAFAGLDPSVQNLLSLIEQGDLPKIQEQASKLKAAMPVKFKMGATAVPRK